MFEINTYPQITDSTDVKASFAENPTQLRNQSLNNQWNLRNLWIGIDFKLILDQ